VSNESLRKAAESNYRQALEIVNRYLDAAILQNKGRMPREEKQRIVQLQMNLLHDRSGLMKALREL
jgi:hypothetical protein